MAYSQAIRDDLRKRYIGGLSLAQAATMCCVPYNTARAWKKTCAAGGDDWERARAAILVSGQGIESINANLVEQISREMLATIAELEKGQIEPKAKVELIASISDAYAKFSRAFTRVNPQYGQLGVALDVIKLMLDVLRRDAPKSLPEFERHMQTVGAEVTRRYASK